MSRRSARGAVRPDGRWVEVAGAPAIPGLRFRHYAGPSDHPAMVEVCNAAGRANRDPEVVTLDGIAVDYANLTNCDPARDILMAEVHGQLVAYGRAFWEDLNDGRRGYHSFGFVHPDWRRRGIGRAMLGWFEQRNAEIAAGHAIDRPRVLISWGYDTDLGNVALLGSSGYRVERRFVHMVRPTLDAIDRPPLPAGLELRPGLEEHARAVFHADAEAFRDHWGAVDDTETSFRRWRDHPGFDPSLWAVAWDGTEVAGAVLGFIEPEENRQHGYQRGWLDSVFVRRPWRQRGVARALIGACLELLRDRGMTSAQLGVDVDNENRALDLYRGAGFEVDLAETAWQKPWPGAERVPDEGPGAHR